MVLDVELNYCILDERPVKSFDILYVDNMSYSLIFVDKSFKLIKTHNLRRSDYATYEENIAKQKEKIDSESITGRTEFDLHIEEFVDKKLFIFTERVIDTANNQDRFKRTFQYQIDVIFTKLLNGEEVDIVSGLMILLYGDDYLSGCSKPYLLWHDEITGSIIFLFHNWIPSVKFLESGMLDELFANSYKHIVCDDFLIILQDRDIREFKGYFEIFENGVPDDIRDLFSGTKLRYDEFCILLSSSKSKEERILDFEFSVVIQKYKIFLEDVSRLCPNICEELLYYNDRFKPECFRDCKFSLEAKDFYDVGCSEHVVVRLICNMRYCKRDTYLANSRLYYAMSDLVLERVVIPNMFKINPNNNDYAKCVVLDFAVDKLRENYVYKCIDSPSIKYTLPYDVLSTALDNIGLLSSADINNDYILINIEEILKGDFAYDIIVNHLINTSFIRSVDKGNKYCVEIPTTGNIADIKDIYTHSDFVRDCIFSYNKVDAFYNYILHFDSYSMAVKNDSLSIEVTKYYVKKDNNALFIDLLCTIILNLIKCVNTDYHGKYRSIDLSELIDCFCFDDKMLNLYERYIKTAIAILYLLNRRVYQCPIFGTLCLEYDKIKLTFDTSEVNGRKMLVATYEG